MTPADIAASRTILAAATQGTWITVQPRSQEGAEALASFGPSFGDDFPAATQIRLAGSGDFGDIAARQARMPWEQHAANCKAAAHAVNTLPVALDALEETRRVLASLVDTLPRCGGGLGSDNVLPHCEPGERQPATWGSGALLFCDAHHAAGWGEEPLSQGDAVRAAIRLLGGGQ